MGLDMSNYKAVYKDIIWNCVSLIIHREYTNTDEFKIRKLEVIVLDDANRIKVLIDDADNFQFIKR